MPLFRTIALAIAWFYSCASLAQSVSSPQWIVQHWSPSGVATTLSSQAANTPTHPASITKLLTAYVTLKAVAKGEQRLTTELTVSPAAAAQDGTRVGYRSGERVALQDALQGMLAISGNDAAWTLGEHVGGNMPSFVQRMNATSKAMGLTHSQWQNPHGLTQGGHMSTAADLAHLAHALWADFPQARPWLGVKTYTWQGVTQSNRNSLLWRDASVDGLKTGRTDAAGYNLAATSRIFLSEKAADSDYEWRLSSVVLGAASANERAADSSALLTWARAAYTPQPIYFANDVVGSVAVAGAVGRFEIRTAQAVWVLLPTGDSKATVRQELVMLPNVAAPLAAGAAIATLNVYKGATLLASHPLSTAKAIDRAPWYRLLWQWVKSLF